MTPERMAEIRQMLTTIGPSAHEDAIGDLLAALDAERARSAKAGRDLVLAGEQARERERALNAQMTEAVMAAEARAQTAEERASGRTTIAHLRDVLREFPDADTSQLWVPADEALAVDDRRDELAKSRRRWVDAFAPLGCNGTPDEHLMALEALVARAQTAEDALAAELSARNLSGEVLQRCDAVLNGPPPGTHWRSLHDVDVQVAALKARAKTAEDALARLREVALGALASSPKPGLTVADLLGRVLIEHEEAMVALDAALAATPADLAEASRREWKAQGLDDAANLAEGFDPEQESMGALVWAIEARATALRGER